MELKEQIIQLGKEIDAKLDKVNEQAKNAAEGVKNQVEESLKGELKNMFAKHQEMVEKQQEQIDAIETKMKRPGGYGEPASFKGDLYKGLEGAKDRLQAKKNGQSGLDVNVALNTKAVGDMSSATNLTGTVVQPQVLPGVVDNPLRNIHVRQFMAVGQTNSNVIRYLRENGPGEGAPGMVAEGALKPQMDFDLESKDAPVRKIAGHIRVPEEMIDDIPYLVSFITNKGVNRLKIVEDAQILYGDGTGINLEGLNTVAAAFAAGTLVVPNPTAIDVIRAASLQIRVAEYAATAAMVAPIDFARMELTKETTGAYLLMNVIQSGLPTLWRLPIIESTAVTPGSFLVGDFQQGAQIFDRQGVNVRLYDQDRDNAIRNLVTIVIEERLALPIYRPAAFVKGTFAAAITDLTS